MSTEVGDRSGNPRADSLLPFAPVPLHLLRRSYFLQRGIGGEGDGAGEGDGRFTEGKPDMERAYRVGRH